MVFPFRNSFVSPFLNMVVQDAQNDYTYWNDSNTLVIPVGSLYDPSKAMKILQKYDGSGKNPYEHY